MTIAKCTITKDGIYAFPDHGRLYEAAKFAYLVAQTFKDSRKRREGKDDEGGRKWGPASLWVTLGQIGEDYQTGEFTVRIQRQGGRRWDKRWEDRWGKKAKARSKKNNYQNNFVWPHDRYYIKFSHKEEQKKEAYQHNHLGWAYELGSFDKFDNLHIIAELIKAVSACSDLEITEKNPTGVPQNLSRVASSRAEEGK
jgi:hypothetical protein